MLPARSALPSARDMAVAYLPAFCSIYQLSFHRFLSRQERLRMFNIPRMTHTYNNAVLSLRVRVR